MAALLLSLCESMQSRLYGDRAETSSAPTMCVKCASSPAAGVCAWMLPEVVRTVHRT